MSEQGLAQRTEVEQEGDMRPAWRTWEELVWEVTNEDFMTAGDFLFEKGMEVGRACPVEAPAWSKVHRQDHCMSMDC